MTRHIKVGKIRIGKGSPVTVQSMTTTDTKDVNSTVAQIRELEKTGCEIVRVAVKDFASASAIRKIKKRIRIPLVADIHFDYRLAVSCIENGADKIRLNPGNIHKPDHVRIVADAARMHHIPIRVGLNSGSVRLKGQKSRAKGLEANDLVKSALGYIKLLEKFHFCDIIVSLKASSVLTTIEAYRKFSKKSDYPLHLGVTAAGPAATGLVKSSIAIGVLLLEGIGDTIRVSLTQDPCQEVIAAKNILQAIGLRVFGPEIISCPTCGRCQVDLQKVVEKLESAFSSQFSAFSGKGLKVAIMGCEVNGPGEAREADIGIACGKHSGVIFKKGKIIKRVKEEEIVANLLHWLKKG